jgi:hypothetical protein
MWLAGSLHAASLCEHKPNSSRFSPRGSWTLRPVGGLPFLSNERGDTSRRRNVQLLRFVRPELLLQIIATLLRLAAIGSFATPDKPVTLKARVQRR